MKQYTSDNVPADMFTKAKLKKMGPTPISEHSTLITIPPNRRRYKLYMLENARSNDSTSGYSLLLKINLNKQDKDSRKSKENLLGNEPRELRLPLFYP